MSMIQMRRGQRIDSRELNPLEKPWAKVGARLDALAVDVDDAVEEPCS